MQHISLTPFGCQPVTAPHLAGIALAQVPAPLAQADKYAILRDLTSARAHGMAESTLRRHLAALVRCRLIARRDSPNGKRYAARAYNGESAVAYGFDLRPLLVRAPEISDAGEAARANALTLRRMRETVVIRLRDAVKLVVWTGGDPVPEGQLAQVSAQMRQNWGLINSPSYLASQPRFLTGPKPWLASKIQKN